MKLLKLDIIDKNKIIEDNYKKLIESNQLLKELELLDTLKDVFTLKQQEVNYIVEDVRLSLLNSLRQVAYKLDYRYYINTHGNNIVYTQALSNENVNINSLDKHEFCNRLTSISINSDDEDYLEEIIKDGKSVGRINKLLRSMENNYILTKNIELNSEYVDKIIFDRDITLYNVLIENDTYINIDKLYICKGYSMTNARYKHIYNYRNIPIEYNGNTVREIIDDYDFNKTYKFYKITIKTCTIEITKLLPRYLNILYIKLLEFYKVNKDGSIVYNNTQTFIREIINDYGIMMGYNVISKFYNNIILIYNIKEQDLDRILNRIKSDIVEFTSILINDKDLKNVEKNLKEKKYCKYY